MDKNFNFDEFLNSLINSQSGPASDEETEFAEALRFCADHYKETLDAFMNVGFTREEAFRLTEISVYTSLIV